MVYHICGGYVPDTARFEATHELLGMPQNRLLVAEYVSCHFITSELTTIRFHYAVVLVPMP